MGVQNTMVRILHFSDDLQFSKTIEVCIKSKNNAYSRLSLNKISEDVNTRHLYDLILVESNDHDVVLKQYTKNPLVGIEATPVILISDEIEFEDRKQYYNLGLMAILSKKDFDCTRLEKYINSLSNEKYVSEQLKNMKVAVVDDSRFSLHIAKEYFEKNQMTNVKYFQNSADFIESSEQFELYLIDLVMPEYDGEYLIHHIRQTNQDAVIILITNYGEGKAISHCLNIGADDFILKPFDYKKFIVRMNNNISRHFLLKQKNENEKKLYELATRDTLTGIYNRTYFIEDLKNKMSQAARNNSALSLILLDLDHFKNINDEYGHMNGDIVLKSVASMLEESLRKSDVVCRWGGEEFIVLLPDTEIEMAGAVAEKLRVSTASLKFEGMRGVTASFGVTQVNDADTDVSLFRRLDNSLYLAKLTGRNKVVSNEELYIVKSGLPVNIEWGPFFKSGNAEIDQDHQNLISMANEIIVSCFNEVHSNKVEILFEALAKEIREHFEREEEILKTNGYKNYEEHKSIHNDLIEKTMFMKDKVKSGETTYLNVVKYLIQEVVVGHIIKSDFEFFSLFQGSL